MANSITLAKKYTTYLDEVYKRGLTSDVLSIPQELVRDGQNAGEVLLPKIALDGLGDYDRATGYPTGSVNFNWETHTLTQDRGVQFTIDRQDNLEALDSVFTFTASQFSKQKVVPELDAYRYAQIASNAGTTVNADLDKTNAVEAIDAAIVELEDNEVNKEGMRLFMTPQIYSDVRNSDLFQRDVMDIGDRTFDTYDNIPIVKVPQGRFYTGITLNDGSSTFGYSATTGGTDYELNFLLVHDAAVLPIVKQRQLKVFDPDTNQKTDGWLMQSRVYHDIFIPDNKTVGIYAHTKATAIA
jgi:hypothetical protein